MEEQPLLKLFFKDIQNFTVHFLQLNGRHLVSFLNHLGIRELETTTSIAAREVGVWTRETS